MNRIRRGIFGRWQGVIVPVATLSLAVVGLTVHGLLMRTHARKTYALPADRSARSMLDFMRKMDGSVEGSETLFQNSNYESVRQAMLEAHRVLGRNSVGLSETERREVKGYFLGYSFGGILRGHSLHSLQESKELLQEAQEFLATSPSFDSRELQLAKAMIQSLECQNRFEEERDIVHWLEYQLSRWPDSPSKSSFAASLHGAAARLDLISNQLRLESTLVDGHPFSLESLRGSVVLLEFWGTHCKPCIDEFPALKRIYAEYHGRGFEIVGVCLNASPARIAKMVDTHQLPWLQLCHDPSATFEGNQELSDRFGIHAVPTTMLLDADHNVIALGVRPLADDSRRDLETLVADLLRDR